MFETNPHPYPEDAPCCGDKGFTYIYRPRYTHTHTYIHTLQVAQKLHKNYVCVYMYVCMYMCACVGAHISCVEHA
jgi:hypothetical protein